MNILITGGAGFIGSHLTERLLSRGDRVIVLDDLNDYYAPAIKEKNLEQARKSDRFSFVRGDIRDMRILDSIREKETLDVVVHLAARAGVRPSLQYPALYADVNCTGTMNVLETARLARVNRFVFASSSSVYGGNATIPFREDAPIHEPLSPYAATKTAGELFCRNYHDLYGISCTALRFFTVYGPRQRPDMAIHKFTAMIARGEEIPFFGDGRSERDYTYINDIIDGLLAAVDRDLGFEVINLGESRTTTLSQLMALIEKHLGKKAILKRMPEQPGDMARTCADVSKARRLLDYKPSTPVEDGVARFVEWYKKQ